MAKSHKDKPGNAKASTAGQVSSEPKLPGTREELLDLHRTTRKRRSEEHRAAIDLIGRIEVEVARIERAMDPPRG